MRVHPAGRVVVIAATKDSVRANIVPPAIGFALSAELQR